jgi:hypothetical protein
MTVFFLLVESDNLRVWMITGMAVAQRVVVVGWQWCRWNRQIMAVILVRISLCQCHYRFRREQRHDNVF